MFDNEYKLKLFLIFYEKFVERKKWKELLVVLKVLEFNLKFNFEDIFFGVQSPNKMEKFNG